MTRQHFKIIFFALTVFVFFFMRIYKLPARIGFDWDQERDAFMVQKMVNEKMPVLIGPRVVGVEGFFLAPWHTYSLLPFYLLGKMNPLIAIQLYSYFFNILLFVVGFFVLKNIFGFWRATIFLFFLGMNHILIGHEISAWNPTPIPLGIIIFWFLLYKLYKTKKTIYCVLLGLTLGLFTNLHFQFIFEIIPGLIFIYYSKNHQRDWVKKTSLFLITAVPSILPLVLFDLRHSFLNTQLFINFFVKKNLGLHVFYPDFLFPIFNSLLPFDLKLPQWGNIVLCTIIYLFFLYLIFKLFRRQTGYKKIFYLSSLIIWITTAIAFSLYGKQVSEYYFVYMLIIVFIVLSEYIVRIKKAPIYLTGIILIFIANNRYYPDIFSPSNLSLQNKDKIVSKIKELAKNKEVYVAIDTPLGMNSGFYYLISYHKINRSDSSHVPLYIINNPPHLGNLYFGPYGLELPRK